MNFDYTEEQKALKDEARRFLSAAAPITLTRRVLNDKAGHDPALWARVVEQGWCGASIPENYGGLGLGYVELCALAEELGRAVAPVPFASSVYQFAEALLVAGSEEQKSALLSEIAAGTRVGTLALSEGPGRTQVVMENLLQRIVDTGSDVAILDITGVPTVDTLTAQHLLKTVTAARLMGAECIISGIRPQIAQTIVHLGVDLGDVITKATLADAFKIALSRAGLTVSKIKGGAQVHRTSGARPTTMDAG